MILLQRISGGTIATSLIAAVLIALFVRGFLAQNSLRVPPVQAVALVAPPPVPPPTPPEARKIEEEVPQKVKEVDAADWVPGAPAGPPGPAGEAGPASPSGPLGLDESGSGGSDAFGLAGRPGGTELLLTGGGGGGGNPSARFVQFAGELQSHIRDQLKENDALLHSCYRVSIRLRVSGAGVVEEVSIARSSGDRKVDFEILSALESLPAMAAPPANMPWPITLQVVASRPDCPR